MLINKGLSQGEVISLKLINGDELIARFEEENAETITVVKPLAITIGSQGLGMIPWMFLGDRDTYTISKNQIFAFSKSKKDAADQYLQSTTGIALA